MTDNDIVAGTDTIFTFLTTDYNYEVVWKSPEQQLEGSNN
jgi:hypothetical protein